MQPAPSSTAVLSNRSSYVLLSVFLMTIALIGVVWWPLLRDYLAAFNPAHPWWAQVDLLLLGIFAAMTILIMTGADVRADARLAVVGLIGGLMIESWGTQTQLWSYYTNERPPLWILPAWPIATLAIDRIIRIFRAWAPRGRSRGYRAAQLTVLGSFLLLMGVFVWPTRAQASTLAAMGLCAVLIIATSDPRTQLLTFAAGAGLGYFLERWGTTRGCWMYYTSETPPLFAVLAHGMAAVAFWRALEVVNQGSAWIAGAARPFRWRASLPWAAVRGSQAGLGGPSNRGGPLHDDLP
jgi:hypothetical protein